jgi:SAM-dependent methyltransferase
MGHLRTLAGLRPDERVLDIGCGCGQMALHLSKYLDSNAHMRPAEVDNYLREVARLLKNKGRCLATFFLLNEQQARLAREGKNALKFDYGQGVWRYRYEHSPESAVAYEESYVLELLDKHALTLKAPIYYGHWSGREDGLSFQDILLLEKGNG